MNYPFTTAKGETILNDEWLVRSIREKCGDEIAEKVEELIDPDGMGVNAGKKMQDLIFAFNNAMDALADLENYMNRADDAIKGMKC